MNDHQKVNAMRSARVLAYREQRDALETETPALMPARVQGGNTLPGEDAPNPLRDALSVLPERLAMKAAARAELDRRILNGPHIQNPGPCGSYGMTFHTLPEPDPEIMADMLRQYAAILESGAVTTAGQYLPQDIRRQADLIGGA